eukprot:2877579-Alexandrium_andersonii.AAC.1
MCCGVTSPRLREGLAKQSKAQQREVESVLCAAVRRSIAHRCSAFHCSARRCWSSIAQCFGLNGGQLFRLLRA